ncbi:hypothetical protein KR038_006934 [Drosophila bunnanda]|nr:hypothetical protein KR038_006934 [Drosophila bunnanda]
MKRGRRANMAITKNFVAGGVYNPNATPKPLIQSAPGPNAQEQQPQQQLQQLQQQLQQQQQQQPQQQQPLQMVLVPSPASSPSPVPSSVPFASTEIPMLPMPIIVKMEPTDASVEPTTIDVSEDSCTTGGKIPFKKIFQKRKKSSERTRDKKQRQNRQLRKSMLPKNALMALNEVKGVTISDFTIDSNPDGGFTAVVTVNSNQYEGKGLSKMSAKNAACEKAWRDFIIAKMTPKKPKLAPAKTSDDNGDEPMDVGDDDSETQEDDLPMLNLASFAIYKLFAEWERDGYVVPEMHPSSANASVPASGGDAAAPSAPVAPKEKKPPVRAELPTGWESLHPATILCIMRPGVTYVDYGTSGDKPNVMQNLGIVVDGQEFTANGRSKKIARRNVAVTVCNALFGTNFLFENPTA